VIGLQLEEQVETIQETADLVRAEYQRARIEEAVESGQVEVLDLATRPGSPIATARARTMALATIIGLMLGIGLAYLRESLDTAFHLPEELEAALPLPTLAMVPRIIPAPLDRATYRSRARRNLPPSVGESHHYHQAMESFRTLGVSLCLSQGSESSVELPGTFLVTSALPGEGKSTTAANLAVARAEAGYRVLLVDCDITNPSLHNLFDVGQSPGLTQVLRGQVPVQDALRTSPFGPALLPSGGVEIGNAPFSLKRTDLSQLLEELRKSFDTIIIDAAPVLLMSNTLVVASVADAVVLVIRAGQTDRSSVQDAIGQLQLVGARLAGTVLNDPDGEVSRYGGGDYRYTSYSYH
jgi:capsular exopolysaccharide synthesis family protein